MVLEFNPIIIDTITDQGDCLVCRHDS
jgi:hypothetical protein